MKKKILIILLLLIPFVSILMVISFRGFVMPTNEEIIKELKEVPFYETKVEYIIKNDRGEEREETLQYYSKDDGARIDFGEDRTKIYKNDEILIKDNISNSEYTIESKMDILHSLAFMNKILSYPIREGSLIEGQEEWGDVVYLQFDVELFLDNEHLNSARVFVDKKNKTPIGIIIYDNEGKDSLRIIYKDFKKVKQIDENLL